MNLLHFFNIKSIAFTICGYDVSYIELFGVMLNFFSMYLMAKDNILNWPIGNVGALFFATLFYQVQLYSEMIQQVYFLIVGFYGWWVWFSLKKEVKTIENKDYAIQHLSIKNTLLCAIIIIVGSLVMGYVMRNISIWLPSYFINSASLPYLDAFVAMISFVALGLIAHKKIESWYLFALIYLILIGINWIKGLLLMVIFFMLLLILAAKGILQWHKLLVND